MVELITTVIVIASSALLFGYWLRCAVVLLRGQYTPPEAFTTLAGEEVFLNPAPSIASNARVS